MDFNQSSRRDLWRKLVILIGLFVGIFIVHDVNSQDKLASSLLWKIEGNNIQPSYLYGTFHLLPQKDFIMKEKVTKAFDQSEQIVLEMDMDDPNLQLKMMQYAPMKDGQTLDQMLSEEDYAIIDRVLTATMGSGLSNFNSFKPFVLSSMLLPTLLDGRPASFEATFAQMAQESQKELLGLETAQEQMSLFDDIPYEEQIDDILDIVKDRDNMRVIFNDMIEVYKKEDISEMYKRISSYMDWADELEYLVLARNRKWISRIDSLAKEKSTFFGVGAGHLGGEEGVVTLLQKAGYSVTPVN